MCVHKYRKQQGGGPTLLSPSGAYFYSQSVHQHTKHTQAHTENKTTRFEPRGKGKHFHGAAHTIELSIASPKDCDLCKLHSFACLEDHSIYRTADVPWCSGMQLFAHCRNVGPPLSQQQQQQQQQQYCQPYSQLWPTRWNKIKFAFDWKKSGCGLKGVGMGKKRIQIPKLVILDRIGNARCRTPSMHYR